MNDLLLHVADADAEAFLKGLLSRQSDLGIAKISISVRKNPNRDSGVFQKAHELCRLESKKYRKIMVLLDYHGSGQEKNTPKDVCKNLQMRLNRCGMEESTVVLFVPELERWLWYTPQAIAEHYGVGEDFLFKGQVIFQNRQKGNPAINPQEDMPKELFRYIVTKHINKSISFSDFEGIAKKLDINSLKQCSYFSDMLRTLQQWFPRASLV